MNYDRCICIPEKQFFERPTFGLLRPLFWVTHDGGYEKIDPSEFPNNGCVYVTKGYEDAANSPEGTLFEIVVSEAANWSPEQPSSSRYATWKIDSNWKKIPARDISLCSVIDGEYPNLSDIQSNTITTEHKITASFFLKCANKSGSEVLIGPLDSIFSSKNDHEFDSSVSMFSYEPPNRPFKYPWERLTDAPNCVYEIEIDTLPDGWELSSSSNGQYVNTGLLATGNKSLLDLSNNSQLIKWFQKTARQTSGSETQAISSNLKDAVEFFSNSENTQLPPDVYQQRLNRLSGLPEQISQSDDFENIMAIFSESEVAGEKIKETLDKNHAYYLDKYRDDEFAKLQQNIQEKKQDLEKQYQEKTKEIENLDKEIDEKKDQLQQSQIEELENKIITLKEEHGFLGNLSELEAKKKFLEQYIEELDQKKASRELMLSEINVKTNKALESHRRDLIGLKLDLDILDGRANDDQLDLSSHQKPASYKALKEDNDIDKSLEFLSIVHSRMESQGYQYSKEYVLKLLIGIAQNLVVTLSGQPGSGKTTTASVLSKALGLIDSEKYIHIQVQRGWTSEKDLLGFNNRLTNTYEPDRYGFYELLRRMQKVDNEDSMALVTLDEANLSPLEYYFSTFMGSFDDKTKFYTQGGSLSLPNGLRFIATINNDRTTETLSERFLDRSPVIVAKTLSDDDYEISFEPENQKYKEFNFDEINNIFNPAINSDSLSLNEKRIFQTLREEHKILSIEKRKFKAMTKFTAVGRDLFQSIGNGNELSALDESIVMYLLPKISGQGNKYKDELSRLFDYLDKLGLEFASQNVKDILQKSQYETYSFF